MTPLMKLMKRKHDVDDNIWVVFPVPDDGILRGFLDITDEDERRVAALDIVDECDYVDGVGHWYKSAIVSSLMNSDEGIYTKCKTYHLPIDEEAFKNKLVKDYVSGMRSDRFVVDTQWGNATWGTTSGSVSNVAVGTNTITTSSMGPGAIAGAVDASTKTITVETFTDKLMALYKATKRYNKI